MNIHTNPSFRTDLRARKVAAIKFNSHVIIRAYSKDGRQIYKLIATSHWSGDSCQIYLGAPTSQFHAYNLCHKWYTRLLKNKPNW